MNLFLVFLGGGLGSLLRYGISEVVKHNFRAAFPLATFCSNVISCIILALTIGLFSEKLGANASLKTFIIVGFCGGFSTFSTFSFETVELMRSGNLLLAVVNIILSVGACTALVWFLSKQTI
ncbi:MAG TPA: fluoride efflux transporter CrcB [Bacteroidia bacterium]|jgi:CrcB protein